MAKTTPPLTPVDWLAFVIAAQCLRSSNAGQQKLGDELLDRYFRRLPAQHSSDAIATAYFDAMLCHVASAMRGFSVARDIFQTQWGNLQKVQEQNIAAAKRLESYGPLSEGNYWSKALSMVAGAGLGAAVIAGLSKFSQGNSFLIVTVILGGAAIGLVVGQWFIERLVNARTSQVLGALPEQLMQSWQHETIESYKRVAKQFLTSASDVTARHYPDWEQPTAEMLNNIAEESFALAKSPNERG